MSNSRTQNTIRNIGFRTLNQILTILLRFVSRSVFIAILSVEYLGISSLFSEILQMLSLADLGFGTAMVFSMYKPLAEQDHTKLTQLINLYKRIYRIIALTITCIGILLIPFLKYLVNTDQEIPHLILYYLLYLANTVASYLVVYKTSILNADQKGYVLSRINTIFCFVSTISCCLCLYFTRSFIAYLIMQVTFTYISNFTCSYVAGKTYPYINQRTEKLPMKETREIFRNVKSVFIYKAATTLVSSTTNTMISILTSTFIVGLYSNYSMVISNLSIMINILFASVTASLGNLIVADNTKKNYQVYKTMQFVSFLLSTFTVACIFTLIDDLIFVWLDETFLLDRFSVIAICLSMYFSVILMPIWSYREATGMYQQTKYVMLFTALVNLITAYVLGKLIGLPGILLAATIARVTTYFWYEPRLLFRQYFHQSPLTYYVNIGKSLIATIAVTGITAVLFHRIHPSTWIGLFAKALGVSVFSLAITLAIYSRNPELHSFIRMIRSFVHKHSAG